MFTTDSTRCFYATRVAFYCRAVVILAALGVSVLAERDAVPDFRQTARSVD
jgi:hypothetical protein